jgi:hypothetical protein
VSTWKLDHPFGERAWRRKRSAGSVWLKSGLVNARTRTNAAVPKAHEYDAKESVIDYQTTSTIHDV